MPSIEASGFFQLIMKTEKPCSRRKRTRLFFGCRSRM
jgi:hypothetical protein